MKLATVAQGILLFILTMTYKQNSSELLGNSLARMVRLIDAGSAPSHDYAADAGSTEAVFGSVSWAGYASPPD